MRGKKDHSIFHHLAGCMGKAPNYKTLINLNMFPSDVHKALPNFRIRFHRSLNQDLMGGESTRKWT